MGDTNTLQRSLTPLMLWGLGVGYVISGMYFGWNLGLEKGGTLGMAVATAFIAFMYVGFTLAYAELSCAIPNAGGVFIYTNRAFGKHLGFVAGIAQMVEFIFAPPAIAFAIGAYLHTFIPDVPILGIAIIAYLLFTALNIYGIKAAASFETLVTILAVGELLLFSALALPHFEWANLQHQSLPNGWGGMLAAIPFAIWFFLGIEGIANVAEETPNPQRAISRGFGASMATLLLLCVLVFVSAVGVGGWETIVYKNGISGETSDSPLPLALLHVLGDSHPMYHLLIAVGVFGLVASFHGLILAAGRSTYEMGKVRQLPAALGKVSARFHTPANALLFNMILGIAALLTGKTAEIITISVFGALSLYILAIFAMLRLRHTEPQLVRPFTTPLYPLLPVAASLIALVALIALFVYNHILGLLYMCIVLGALGLFVILGNDESINEDI